MAGLFDLVVGSAQTQGDAGDPWASICPPGQMLQRPAGSDECWQNFGSAVCIRQLP